MRMNCKGLLNEYCAKNGLHSPQYNLHKMTCNGFRSFFDIGCVVGDVTTTVNDYPTKKEAEQAAACLMYEKLSEIETVKAPPDIYENSRNIIILLDGDNVPISFNTKYVYPPRTFIHVFVTKDKIVKEKNVHVHRTCTDFKDATDIKMILFADKYIQLLDHDDIMWLVSKDHIFETYVREKGMDNVRCSSGLDEVFMTLR